MEYQKRIKGGAGNLHDGSINLKWAAIFLVSFLPLFLIISCAADNGEADADSRDDGPESISWNPPESANLKWEFVSPEGAVCANGEPTGFGVNFNGESRNLLVYMQGGGACWNREMCFGENSMITAAYVDTGYSEVNFRGEIEGGADLGLMNREATNNPFREDSYLYIPYCTGDLHAGDNVYDYGDAVDRRVIHHKGGANVGRSIEYLASVMPELKRVTVTGGSAGGYGALLNFHRFVDRFDEADAYMIDNSGPLLAAPALPLSVQQIWRDAWNIGANLPADCDRCDDDLSYLFDYLIDTMPDAGLALLSYKRDPTISIYLGISTIMFENALELLTERSFEGSPNFRYFYLAGEGHVLSPTVKSADGTYLIDWLTAMVEETDGWVSVAP